jgi:DNA-binding NarL/FixJ family response regulator
MSAALGNSEGSLKVLVVDDHPLVREALGMLLRQLGPAVEVLEATSLAAAVSCVTANPLLTLVILDLTLPDATGIAAVEHLLHQQPDLPVIVLSAKDDPATARAVLHAGARGFISKRSPTRVLTEALRLVVVGGTYVPPQALQDDAPVARKDPPPDGDALAFAARKTRAPARSPWNRRLGTAAS